MDAVGIALVWCALQVMALCVAAVLLYLATRRLVPGLGSPIALSTLLLSAALTALAFSPWPRWWHNEVEDRVASDAASTDEQSRPRSAPVHTAVSSKDDETSRAVSQSGMSSSPLATASSFLTALADELTYANPGQPAPARRWPLFVTLFAVAGVVVGAARLLLGGWAVREYRRRSRPIHDAALGELLDLLRAGLGCRRRVEVRESDWLVTAATIGWRRPLILLPAGWRDWTDPQRRAVLSHELAHVRRNDFLAWLGAELGLLLHFYNPLVHWLAGRLRLEQELAADAAAAALSGGQRPYLTSLAELALGQSNRRLSWPARAFLPTRRTFLRRIEMLRDAKRLTSTPPMLLRASAVGAVLAAALAIAGLRGPVAQAQDESTPKLRDSAPAAAGNRDASGPLDLAYVPADAVLVGAVRPAAVYARFDGPPLRQLLEEQKLPFDIEAIEQATFVLFRHGRPADTPEPQFGGFIIRTTTAEQTKQLLELLAREPTAKRYAGRPYYVNEGNGLQYLSMPDDTTLIVAEEEANLFRLIDAGPNPPERAAWWEAWQEVRDADAAAAVDVAFVRQSMNLEFAGPNGGGLPPQLAAFAPIWENTQNAAYGISLDDGIAWDAAAYCKNPEGAQRVARTIDALATLARNMLGLASSELAQIPDEPTRKLAEGMLAMAEQLLESLTVETEGDVVRIHAEAKGEGGDPMLAALILPAIQKSREAARRTQSMNNLRQIAIAMHSYADAHKGLPPAVVLGPDGKTPHSWRVALLPYLEQEALYRQYNLNQPWDSENNRRVLEQMPDVYRHPSGPDGTTAGYFVFTGPKSLFSAEPKHKGTWFGEVTDGTSHTLLVVEANRDIPWTKPEDIPFDPEGELPELGGFHEQGFNAVLADGAARFIMDTVDPETLRLLIMMNDGTPVPEY